MGSWRMEGDSNDGSGNGRHGADTNIAYIAGRFGKAADFNGTTSHILLPGNLVPKTISLHANFNAVVATSYFLGAVITTSGVRYNDIDFLVFAGGGGSVAVPWAKVDAMVHFVAVNTSGRLWDMYIEGQKIGTGDSGPSTTVNIQQFGRRSDGFYFDGPLDEIVLLDRILIESDIRRLKMGLSPVA